MDRSAFTEGCNTWAEEGIPFLFMIDYEMEQFELIPLEKAADEQVFFEVNGRSNGSGLSRYQVATLNISDNIKTPKESSTSQNSHLSANSSDTKAGRASMNSSATISNNTEQGVAASFPGNPGSFRFNLLPVPFERYESAFDLVQKNIHHGNSFLLNLTFPTEIDTDLTLQEIFRRSSAPYKLYYKDRFVLFSPETFIRIRKGHIYSYPMKGTIDASIPGARELLLGNDKERWEHNTIVDLIRNDLSMVSKDVEVTKYRYIDHVRTHKNELLQVSSEIRGRLPEHWNSSLGDLLLKILPAGSISGAPKKKTLEIIARAEGQKRGYFTGIFGIFDGENLDSAVMIRYIERHAGGLRFRSGGGITGHSDVQKEYNEMIEKVYVPFI